MSNEKLFLQPSPLTFGRSRRIRIIKNSIYLVSFLDFLLHYALTVEMNVFEQIYQAFGMAANSTAISVCQSPIKRYLRFTLSELSLYILYFSILTLLISTEAMRKSSFPLHRTYVIIKFTFAMISLSLCTIYTIIDRRMSFISPSLPIPYKNVPISITVDPCLTYAREKMATYVLSIVNVFVFLLSLEFSKVFSFVRIKVIQI